MKKTKNMAYGIVFGLAIFGIVMMSMGIAAADRTSSVDKSWETTESGAQGIGVGAKGVNVEFWREYKSDHGAHIAAAARAGFYDGSGYAEWWSIDMADTNSDHHGLGADYIWTSDVEFDMYEGYETTQMSNGILHRWNFEYKVTEDRVTPWPWGGYYKVYEGTMTCSIYHSSGGMN
ncbi:MAG: hypothetical protein R6W73_10145 [Candidatus Saliniplasma sp.]